MPIDPEIRKQITSQITKKLNDELEDIRDKFALDLSDFYECYSYIKKRMVDIEAMIHKHAIGVQNVYTQMQEIKYFFQLAKMDDAMLEKISRIKEIIE